jgi:hypothetical protein
MHVLKSPSPRATYAVAIEPWLYLIYSAPANNLTATPSVHCILIELNSNTYYLVDERENIRHLYICRKAMAFLKGMTCYA